MSRQKTAVSSTFALAPASGLKMLPSLRSHRGCLTSGPGPLILLVDVGSLPATQTLKEGRPSPRQGAQKLSAWPGDGGHEVPQSIPWAWHFVRNFQRPVLLGPRTKTPQLPQWLAWTQPSESPFLGSQPSHSWPTPHPTPHFCLFSDLCSSKKHLCPA